MSKVDPCCFFYRLDEHLRVTGILACHADDFIWPGPHTFTAPAMLNRFSREEHNSVDSVGMGFGVKTKREIYIKKKLQPALTDPLIALQRDSPLMHSEADKLRSKTGHLLWVAKHVQTTYASLHPLKKALVQTWLEVNNVVRRFKSENVVLKFPG